MDRLSRGAASVFSAVLEDDPVLLKELLSDPPPPREIGSKPQKRGDSGKSSSKADVHKNASALHRLGETNDATLTALHIAASSGAVESVEFLLELLATERTSHEFAAFLNAVDAESHWSAIHRAIYAGNLGVSLQLLRAGAVIDCPDEAALRRRGVRDMSKWQLPLLHRSTLSGSAGFDRDGLTPLDLSSLALLGERTAARTWISNLRSQLRSGKPLAHAAAVATAAGSSERRGQDEQRDDDFEGADEAALASFADASLDLEADSDEDNDANSDPGASSAVSRASGASRGRRQRRRQHSGQHRSGSRQRDRRASSVSLASPRADGITAGNDVAAATLAASANIAISLSAMGATATSPGPVPVEPVAPPISFDFRSPVHVSTRSVEATAQEQLQSALAHDGLPDGSGLCFSTRVLTFGRSEFQLGHAGLGHGDKVSLPRAVALPDDPLPAPRERPVPGDLVFDTPVVGISAGRHHNLLLRSSGHVVVFGMAQGGRLGLGVSASGGRGGQSSLVPAPTPQLLSSLSTRGVTITSVSCGDRHSLLIDASGCLWAFGDSSRGACGLGKVAGSHLLGGAPSAEDSCVVSQPVRVEALRKMTVTAAAAGPYHSVAIADGGVYTWGSNLTGQTGNKDTPHAAAVQAANKPAPAVTAAGGKPAQHAGTAPSAAGMAGYPVDVIAACTVWLPRRADPLPAPLAVAHVRSGGDTGVESDASDSESDDDAALGGIGLALPLGARGSSGRPSRPSFIVAAEGYSLVLSTHGEVFAAGAGGGASPGAGWHRCRFDGYAADAEDALAAYRASDAALREREARREAPASAGAISSTLSSLGFHLPASVGGSSSEEGAGTGATDAHAWVSARVAPRAGSGGGPGGALGHATGRTVRVLRISASKHHALCVDSAGGLWAWSERERSALWGGSDTPARPAGGAWTAPARVAPLYRAGIRCARAAAGLHTSFAVDTHGNLWSAGDAAAVRDNLLGHQLPPPLGGAVSSSGRGWCRVPSVKGALDVAAGDHHACVVVVHAAPRPPPLRPSLCDLQALQRVAQAAGGSLRVAPSTDGATGDGRWGYRGLLLDDLRVARDAVAAEDRVVDELLRGVDDRLAAGRDAATVAAAAMLPPIGADGSVSLIPSLKSLCERALASAGADGVTLASLGPALAAAESVGADGLGAYCGLVASANVDVLLSQAEAAWQGGGHSAGGGASSATAASLDVLVRHSSGLVRGGHMSHARLSALRASEGAAHASTVVRLYRAMKRAEYAAIRPAATWRGMTASRESRWRATWAPSAQSPPGASAHGQALGSAAMYGISDALFACVNRDAALTRARLFPDPADASQSLWSPEEEEANIAALSAARSARASVPLRSPPSSPKQPARHAPHTPSSAPLVQRTRRHVRAAGAPTAASIAASIRASSIIAVPFARAWAAVQAVAGAEAARRAGADDDEHDGRSGFSAAATLSSADPELVQLARTLLPRVSGEALPPAVRSASDRLCTHLIELGIGHATAACVSAVDTALLSAPLEEAQAAADAVAAGLLSHARDVHFGDVGVPVCRDLLSRTMLDDASTLFKRFKASRKRLLEATAFAVAIASAPTASGDLLATLSIDQRARLSRRRDIFSELVAFGRLLPIVRSLLTHVAAAVAEAGPATDEEEAYLGELLALSSAADGALEGFASLASAGLSVRTLREGPWGPDSDGLGDVTRSAVIGAGLLARDPGSHAGEPGSPGGRQGARAAGNVMQPLALSSAASGADPLRMLPLAPGGVQRATPAASAGRGQLSTAPGPGVDSERSPWASVPKPATKPVLTPAFGVAPRPLAPAPGAPATAAGGLKAAGSSSVPPAVFTATSVPSRQASLSQLIAANNNRAGAFPAATHAGGAHASIAYAAPIRAPPPAAVTPPLPVPARSLRDVMAAEAEASHKREAAARMHQEAVLQQQMAHAAAARAAEDKDALQARKFLAAANNSGAAHSSAWPPTARRSLADIQREEAEVAARQRQTLEARGHGASSARQVHAHTPWGAPSLVAATAAPLGGARGGTTSSLSDILSSEEASRLHREAEAAAAAAALAAANTSALAKGQARRAGPGGKAPAGKQPQQPTSTSIPKPSRG